ncbi:hypothetical protein BD560DRAFT_119415 [Blakeslea trispora]|nr:hypothetical protein BD560DRAFT_119415 [Blakeslea trispora]
MMYQIMLNIPLDDLMNFPKLSKAFFDMIDEFSAEQMMLDADMPPEAFLYIMEACELGAESTDSWVRTHACSAIYNICSFLIQQTQKAEIRRDAKGQKSKPIQGLWFLNYFEQFPQILPKLLSTLFGMILFDDNSDQWQLSRPLYTLVLLQRDFASKYTNQVILQQLPERREYVTKALGNLMEGSTWTLSSKDRERFSQQIASLKRELNNHQITLVPLK